MVHAVETGERRMAQSSSILFALSLLLASTTGVVGAQGADAISPRARSVDGHPAVDRYEPVFDQLRHMTAQGDRVATVRNLTLRRDVIEFRLEDGQLFIATPVAGRTIAAMFVGHGSVSFAPPTEIERRELKRVTGDSVLNARIPTAAFVFTDSTLAELERQVTFQTGGVADRASDILHDALDRLVDGRRVVQPTLITAVLNAEANGFFYAHIKRERGEDLMFVVDPAEEEQIALLRGGREGRKV